MASVALNKFHILQTSTALKHKAMLTTSLSSCTVTSKCPVWSISKRDEVVALTDIIFSLEQE